ncbi:unnamed protein product, partial [Rotaria magnacalcarata]
SSRYQCFGNFEILYYKILFVFSISVHRDINVFFHRDINVLVHRDINV